MSLRGMTEGMHDNPILIEVTRGLLVESSHRGAGRANRGRRRGKLLSRRETEIRGGH